VTVGQAGESCGSLSAVIKGFPRRDDDERIGEEPCAVTGCHQLGRGNSFGTGGHGVPSTAWARSSTGWHGDLRLFDLAHVRHRGPDPVDEATCRRHACVRALEAWQSPPMYVRAHRGANRHFSARHRDPETQHRSAERVYDPAKFGIVAGYGGHGLRPPNDKLGPFHAQRGRAQAGWGGAYLASRVRYAGNSNDANPLAPPRPYCVGTTTWSRTLTPTGRGESATGSTTRVRRSDDGPRVSSRVYSKAGNLCDKLAARPSPGSRVGSNATWITPSRIKRRRVG